MAQNRKLYKEVASRVLAAIDELNAAVREAYEHPQVRVHFGPHGEDLPCQLGCEVTRITGHRRDPEAAGMTMAWKVYVARYDPKKPKKGISLKTTIKAAKKAAKKGKPHA